jgi:hypothetical protein
MKTQYISLLAFSLLASFTSLAQAPDTAAVQTGALLEFKESSFNFGQIVSGETISYVFKFKNTGTVPLTITDAKGSCGCTVPSWPKVPIMPGEGSEIEVAFNSKGKMGKQAKRITITANTVPAQTYLTMEGEVLAPDPTTSEESNPIQEMQHEHDRKLIQALDPNCFAIFPNPVNDLLQLELKDHIGMAATVEIRDEKGATLMSKTIDQISRESTQFDVSTYALGVYMITIQIGDFAPMTQCFVRQ